MLHAECVVRPHRLEAGKVIRQGEVTLVALLGGRSQRHGEGQLILLLHGRPQSQSGPAQWASYDSAPCAVDSVIHSTPVFPKGQVCTGLSSYL